MAVKITAPAPVTGTQTYGPVTLSFEDGVAVADELPKMVRSYMERRGYTVKTQRKAQKGKSEQSAQPETEQQEPEREQEVENDGTGPQEARD